MKPRSNQPWNWMLALFLALTTAWLASGVQAQTPVTSEPMYTAYNIWWEEPDTLYCINYKVGNFIPAGTQVYDAQVTIGQEGAVDGHHVIAFRTQPNGIFYKVRMNPDWHPGKTLNDYFGYMFTEKDFGALTAGMNDKEIEAIKRGVLVVGMSRDAVLVSYGYPPEHHTPSLEQGTWTYWMNRFRQKEVHFNEEGRTSYGPSTLPGQI